MVARSIADYLPFEREFLEKWEDKKNPLQLLTQYNNLKTNQVEIVEEFSTRFLKIYQSSPPLSKPPLGDAQLHYNDDFENDFSLLPRERKSETLSIIMNDAVEVDVNMIASAMLEQRIDHEKRRPQLSEVRLETMMRKMEMFFEKLVIHNRPPRQQSKGQESKI